MLVAKLAPTGIRIGSVEVIELAPCVPSNWLHGHQWIGSRPKIIYADFETAIHAAARSVCSAADIRGCHFHLGQPWWKNIQEAGLSKVYTKKKDEKEKHKKDDDEWLVQKLIFGLPFLEPEEVEEAFDELVAMKPVYDKSDEFFKY